LGHEKQKPMHGLQGEGRRTVEHLCGGKIGRSKKIEWDIHVWTLAHPRPLLLGCNNKASHITCSEIRVDVKQAHMWWMKKVCRNE
jgi:hypothetical protein